MFLDVDNGVVKDVRFQGSGCAISTASASMMTESIKGKTRAEMEALFEEFHQMLTGPQGVELEDDDELGKLVVFLGCEGVSSAGEVCNVGLAYLERRLETPS